MFFLYIKNIISISLRNLTEDDLEHCMFTNNTETIKLEISEYLNILDNIYYNSDLNLISIDCDEKMFEKYSRFHKIIIKKQIIIEGTLSFTFKNIFENLKSIKNTRQENLPEKEIKFRISKFSSNILKYILTRYRDLKDFVDSHPLNQTEEYKEISKYLVNFFEELDDVYEEMEIII